MEALKAKLDAEGQPIKGPDGFFARDKLLFYTAMQMQKGWGDGFPELIRNGDWNYAVFKADGSLRSGVIRPAVWSATDRMPMTGMCFPFDN